ncbi:MAG: MBL fold metallo-hydrolase [Candidatus Zixiibacteriota bacterium]
MTENNERRFSWRGENLRVEVLFTRAGVAQQIWVENDDGALLFDTGDGTLRDIFENECQLDKLKGLFYTHGHFDHMGGLHSLLGFMRMVVRQKPLPVYAPEGCTEVFSTVVNFKRCYPDTTPFVIPCHELRGGDRVEAGSMTVEAFEMMHCGSLNDGTIQDPVPALGYRVVYRGETIAVTGDTGLTGGVRELVKGVNLALIEATMRDSKEMGDEFLNKVHLSEDVAVELGRTAKAYILVHKGRR